MNEIKKNLGLPLEYQKIPQYFDLHNTGQDTELNNSAIESLLKKNNVETVLDMTCGTGSQVFFLSKLGYKVVGSDFSPDLLKIARDKAQAQQLNLEFIDGDMRRVKVGTFDSVITIFNAIGHLTKSDFQKAIRNVHNNLKDGGIYVFDIFNLSAMTDEVVQNFAYCITKKVEDLYFHTAQCSTIDRQNGILTSYDAYMIQKKSEVPERFNNEFSLQIYSAKELGNLLERNGFEVVTQCDMLGNKFVEEKSLSILTVARKV